MPPSAPSGNAWPPTSQRCGSRSPQRRPKWPRPGAPSTPRVRTSPPSRTGSTARSERRDRARVLAEALSADSAAERARRETAADRDDRVAASDFSDAAEATAALRDADTRATLDAGIREHEAALRAERDRLRELELELAGAPEDLIDLEPSSAALAAARDRWSRAVDQAAEASQTAARASRPHRPRADGPRCARRPRGGQRGHHPPGEHRRGARAEHPPDDPRVVRARRGARRDRARREPAPRRDDGRALPAAAHRRAAPPAGRRPDSDSRSWMPTPVRRGRRTRCRAARRSSPRSRSRSGSPRSSPPVPAACGSTRCSSTRASARSTPTPSNSRCAPSTSCARAAAPSASSATSRR